MSSIPTQTFIKDIDIINTYNQKRLLVDEMPATLGIPHVFFTTPMMNFNGNNCMTDGFLSYMRRMHTDWLSTLSYQSTTNDSDVVSTTSPFIKLLYNSTLEFQTKDNISKTKEVGETYYGYKETLPASNVDSEVGDEITITFGDWKNQPVLHILNAWFIYHNLIRRGEIYPNYHAIEYSYLDYVSTIYYFITEMDNQTLQYWAKFTGVAPISVPFSAFSSDYQTHDILKYSANFVYSFKEDMNPDILLDFNDVANGCAGQLNFKEYEGNQHHTMKTGYQIAKGSSGDFLTTEFEQNGLTHPEIALVARTQSSGLVSEVPKFKLLFT